jgi:endonuclease/exonuclease/phosphatase family metal-dependent hydrolase
VLAGDLNTTPAGFPNASIGSDGRTAFDQLVEGNDLQWQPQSPPDARQLTFSTLKPGNVIDWILVSKKHWDFIDYGVFPSQLSDHFPVQAVIKIRH